jgi:hypothetical protein
MGDQFPLEFCLLYCGSWNILTKLGDEKKSEFLPFSLGGSVFAWLLVSVTNVKEMRFGVLTSVLRTKVLLYTSY